MTYPSRSDFNSPAPGSAWFAVVPADPRAGAATRVCATTGRSFVKRLQRRLNAARERMRVGVGPLSASPMTEVPLSDAWDDATMYGVIQYIRYLGVVALEEGLENSALEALEAHVTAAREARRVTRETLHFALWIAYLDGTDHGADAVRLDADPALPVYGAAPPDDGNRDPELGAACADLPAAAGSSPEAPAWAGGLSRRTMALTAGGAALGGIAAWFAATRLGGK
jgi:hypothetical protein